MVSENVSVDKNITINDIRASIADKDYIKAEELCKFLLKAEPMNTEILYILGFIRQHFNQTEESRKFFTAAITVSENKIGNWCIELGNSYCKDELFNEALTYYNKAIKLLPDKKTNLYNNIGIIYKKQNDFPTAIKYYEEAIKLSPKNVAAMSNLALIYKEMGDFSKAEDLYRHAISIKPDFVCAHYNYGLTLKDQNRPEEAIPYIRKALELDANFTDAYMDYAICLLVSKNFKEGLKAYENRYAGMQEPKPAGNKPKWQGEPLDGKTIYVFHEQGQGDTIQFVRYLHLLKNLGANVRFKPQKELLTLLNDSDLGVEISERFLKEDEYDYYSMLLSLPFRLNAEIDNVPLAEGYLKADSQKVKDYRQKYFKDVKKFKVGIFWQGSQGFKNDKKRSTKLEYFYQLAQLNNVQLYSLQKGFGEEQLENIPEDINIINLGNTFNDFSDTAAAIENLDLVITVDSAVSHLAGALNKPVWILQSFIWEWRWFGSSDKTPWYNSMRIFIQKNAGNWEELFERVYSELKSLSKS